jgi:hypothetical protein
MTLFTPSKFSFEFGNRELLKPFSRWALIFTLFQYRCPSHIAWFVGPVFIGVAVQSFIRRPSTYVREKLFKRFPSFANLDATTSVVFVLWIFWVTASVAHANPSMVRRMYFPVSSIPVSAALHAPTGTNKSTSKVTRRGGVKFATIASATPQDVPVWIPFGSWTDSDQFTETLVCNINRFWCYTSARTSFSSKIGNVSSRSIAAITPTLPHCTSTGILADRFDRDQSPKPFTCDIDVFAHGTAPIGSREVAGSALPTLTSLRTLARVTKVLQ